MATRSLQLGLDWGGTNVKWAVLAGEDVLEEGSEPTDRRGGEEAVRQLERVARDLAGRHAGVATVGIGVPGTYDPADGSLLRVVNVPGAWEGVPLAARVAAAVGVPAAVVNDARAWTLAEHRLGAGRGTRTLLCVALGTGVGGGLVVGGRLHLAGAGSAGEIGHMPIDPAGPPCACGARGCLETYASAGAIAARCGTATAADAAAAAHAGDATALAGFAAVGDVLGRALAALCLLAMPEAVVVGGGVAAAGDLLLGPVRDVLAAHAQVARLDRIRVEPAALGRFAGAVGAALHGAEPHGHGVAPVSRRAGRPSRARRVRAGS